MSLKASYVFFTMTSYTLMVFFCFFFHVKGALSTHLVRFLCVLMLKPHTLSLLQNLHVAMLTLYIKH